MNLAQSLERDAGYDKVRLLTDALANGHVDTFQLRRPTLEQVFLDVVRGHAKNAPEAPDRNAAPARKAS